jgi:hypothetical protein
VWRWFLLFCCSQYAVRKCMQRKRRKCSKFNFYKYHNHSWGSEIHWRCSYSMRVNSTLTITILDIMHRPVFYLKVRRFGDLILSPSSGYPAQVSSIERASLCVRTAIGPIWVGSIWRRRQRQVSETSVLNWKTGRGIVSRIVIVILIYHRHKHVDSINLLLFCQVRTYRVELSF